MRLFIALDIPNNIKAHIARIADQIPFKPGKAKKTDINQYHVTLKFIGEFPDEKRQPLIDSLANIIEDNLQIKLQTLQPGAFPDSCSPNIVWLGIADRENLLEDIVHMLDEKLGIYGVLPEKRKFHAHITLVRIKDSGQKKHIAGFLKNHPPCEEKMFFAESITLYQSILSSSGPEYHPLAKINLKTT